MVEVNHGLPLCAERSVEGCGDMGRKRKENTKHQHAGGYAEATPHVLSTFSEQRLKHLDAGEGRGRYAAGGIPVKQMERVRCMVQLAAQAPATRVRRLRYLARAGPVVQNSGPSHREIPSLAVQHSTARCFG